MQCKRRAGLNQRDTACPACVYDDKKLSGKQKQALIIPDSNSIAESGGGACATRNSAIGGINVCVSAASSTAINEAGGSVDFGCPVDADLMTDGENPYENFYDLSLLSEKMNEYFENR